MIRFVTATDRILFFLASLPFFSSMHRMYLRFFGAVFVVLIASIPALACASVRINEIAWMGTANSASDEWVELHNDSAVAADVTGWTLVAEDGAPAIALAGLLAPGGYYLVERTDDESVPGVAADLVASFGSGLSNAGEKLFLKDSSGLVVDMVDGIPDWVAVGGDNTTKETAQQSASGWITAGATPKAANAESNTTPAPPLEGGGGGGGSAPASSASGANTSSSVAAKASSAKYPRPNITIDAGEDRRVFVGQSVEFSGVALGLYDNPLPFATYRWNWGDGATGVGATTSHRYAFAGEYVVTLEVFSGELRNIARLTVSVEEPMVTIAEVRVGERGYVRIKNDTKREVALAGWKLSDDQSSFTIPPHTILPAGKTITLANDATGVARALGTVTLVATDGVMIAAWSPKELAIAAPVMSSGERVTGEVKGSATEKHPTVKPILPDIALRQGGAPAAALAATMLSAGDGVQGEKAAPYGFWKWGLGLVVLVLLGWAGIAIAHSGTGGVSEADKYAIIEDLIETGEDEKA